MKTVTASFHILACAGVLVQAIDVSPIGKVIQMISDLQVKLMSEGTEAQKVYEEFAEFCEDRSKQLGFEIKTGTSEKEELEATIAKEISDSGAHNEKIEELASSIARDEADLSAATKVREKEAADFSAEETELTEVISMLERAIAILQREMQKAGSTSMLQLKNVFSLTQTLSLMVEASALSEKDGRKLAAFLQNRHESEDADDDASLNAPAAAVYEGHSGNIIETLENLLEKAEEQLAEIRKKETAALNNYEMLKQALTDDINFANKDMDEQKKGLAASGEIKAVAEGDLLVTTKDLQADTVSLADLHKDCLTKAQDFESATQSRGEEIKALAEAKKVIIEKTGGADKITYGPSQTSFLQVRTDSAQFEAVQFLRNLARKQHSPSLAQLASRLAAMVQAGGQDPFGKVKGLIADMITKLEAAATADATEKAYCDKELSETNAKKHEKSAEVEKLTTQIETMTARAAKLKEEVADLQKALAELAAAQAEMNKLRDEEAADYGTNKATMEQGLEGVKLALKILEELYGAATTGAGASIIGLLEVAESDMSKTLAEIIATEETAKSTYITETKENDIEKATKDQDVKYKTKEAGELEKAVAESDSDRKGVQTELAAVLEYLKSIEERCIAKAETYEERKARREAELAGLKEALSILDGQAVLLQKKARRALRGV